ncbi:MBL fold metallo-hydrolase [candidate division KSB1 bacterium]
MQLEKISDRLYVIKGGSGANGGVYIGDESVLLVDSKSNQSSVDQVFAEINKITDKPVKYLINTHSDGDHIGGNRYLPDGVTVISHENCRKDFFLPGRNDQPSQWENEELLPFVPSVTFTDKMDLYMGKKKIELRYFGVGHTTGDAVVYFPDEKAAFLGDQIFVGRTPLIHAYKGGNSFEQVKTLTKMLETLDAEVFSSGHAENQTPQDIRNYINQMKSRQEKIMALSSRGSSLEDIKAQFEENEASLVEIIYNEVQKMKRQY